MYKPIFKAVDSIIVVKITGGIDMEVIEMEPSDFLSTFTEWEELEVDQYNGTVLYLLSTEYERKTYRTICSATGKTKEDLMRENFEPIR